MFLRGGAIIDISLYVEPVCLRSCTSVSPSSSQWVPSGVLISKADYGAVCLWGGVLREDRRPMDLAFDCLETLERLVSATRSRNFQNYCSSSLHRSSMTVPKQQ